MKRHDDDTNWFLIIAMCGIIIPFAVFFYLFDAASRWRIRKENVGWWASTGIGVLVLALFLAVILMHSLVR